MSRLHVAAAASHRVEIASGGIPGGPATLAAWFRVGTPQALAAIFGVCGSTLNRAFMLLHDSAGSTVQAYVQGGTGGVYDLLNTTTTVGTGVWAHAAASCSGTAIGSTLTVYLNGGGKATQATTVTCSSLVRTAAGRFAGQAQNYFDGRIAEAACWNVVLSDAEVLALASGAPPPNVRPRALALYWPLWGVASPEPDLSGGARPGTVTGATVADHSPTGRAW